MLDRVRIAVDSQIFKGTVPKSIPGLFVSHHVTGGIDLVRVELGETVRVLGARNICYVSSGADTSVAVVSSSGSAAVGRLK